MASLLSEFFSVAFADPGCGWGGDPADRNFLDFMRFFQKILAKSYPVSGLKILDPPMGRPVGLFDFDSVCFPAKKSIRGYLPLFCCAQK